MNAKTILISPVNYLNQDAVLQAHSKQFTVILHPIDPESQEKHKNSKPFSRIPHKPVNPNQIKQRKQWEGVN